MPVKVWGSDLLRLSSCLPFLLVLLLCAWVITDLFAACCLFTISSYDSLTGCDAALLSQYELFLENHCFEVVNPAYGDYSYKFTFPTLAVHDGLGCKSKHPETQALATTCEAANAENEESGYYSVSMVEAGKAVTEEWLTSAVQRLVTQLRERTAGAKAADISNEIDATAAAESPQIYGYGQTDDLFEQWSLVHSKAALNAPSATPTARPTAAPTNTPAPSAVPTYAPSSDPTPVPTFRPTPKDMPTVTPTEGPTAQPTDTAAPTAAPTVQPSQTSAPTPRPTQPQPVGPPLDQLVTIIVTQV